MSIRKKIIAGLVSTLILFLSITVFHYYHFYSAKEQLNLIHGVYFPFSKGLIRLHLSFLGINDRLKKSLTVVEGKGIHTEQASSKNANHAYVFAIKKKIGHLRDILQPLRKYDAFEPSYNSFEQGLNKLENSIHDLFDERELAQFDQRSIVIQKFLEILAKLSDQESQRITARVQKSSSDHLASLVNFTLFTLLVGLLLIVFIYRALKPIPILITWIKDNSSGVLRKIDITDFKHSELEYVVIEFNRMLSNLIERDQKILVQQKELLKQGKLAAIGEISAEIVHEVRNPLNSMSLNLEWLKSELYGAPLANEEVVETLDSITKELQRLNQITEGYLNRARGSINISDYVNVHEVINEVLHFEAENLKVHNIKLDSQLSNNLPQIVTNQNKLRQILVNVIKNAVESFDNKEGLITVRTSNQSSKLVVEITDNGCGFDLDATHHFSPFYTTKANGTGLGMSVTKQIVEELGAEVFWESEPNKGTTVKFLFPMEGEV